jgi:GNAT superfamily N-acetyltransferase
VQIRLLADHRDLIPAVGQFRWQEWGHWPERAELSWWVDVTARESGRDDLPVTFVAIDAGGEAVGAVGLGEFDPAERRDRSPWVLGMIVRPDLRGGGVGRMLLEVLGRWAAEHGHPRLWVATGNPAVGFYQACGWSLVETFDRPGENVNVLTRLA